MNQLYVIIFIVALDLVIRSVIVNQERYVEKWLLELSLEFLIVKGKTLGVVVG